MFLSWYEITKEFSPRCNISDFYLEWPILKKKTKCNKNLFVSFRDKRQSRSFCSKDNQKVPLLYNASMVKQQKIYWIWTISRLILMMVEIIECHIKIGVKQSTTPTATWCYNFLFAVHVRYERLKDEQRCRIFLFNLNRLRAYQPLMVITFLWSVVW